MNLLTTKGLFINPNVGDIVTVENSSLNPDLSYNDMIFEIKAISSSAVVVEILYSPGWLDKIHTRRLMQRRYYRFYEASELWEALQPE